MPISRSCRRVVVMHAAGELVVQERGVEVLRPPDRQLLGRGQPVEVVAATRPSSRSSMSTRWPISRRLATVRRASGSDEPLPSAPQPVCTTSTPSSGAIK